MFWKLDFKTFFSFFSISIPFYSPHSHPKGTSQQTIENDIRNSHLSCSQDFSQELKNLHIENSANPVFAYVNINSIRNKFNDLQELIKGNIDVVMIAETKMHLLQQRNFYSVIIISLSDWI